VKSVKRPHRIADDGAVRLVERDHHVVGVDRLCNLAWIDGDRRERRDQATRVEHAFDHRQDILVHRNEIERCAEFEQIVDADRLVPLEAVHCRLGIELALQAIQRRIQCIDQRRRDRVLDDGEAVLGDAFDVLCAGLFVHGYFIDSEKNFTASLCASTVAWGL
jgi:hypothetical protein